MTRKMYRVNPDGSVSDYICDGRIESKARISHKDPDGVTVYFRDESKEMRMNPDVAEKYYNQTPIHTSESQSVLDSWLDETKAQFSAGEPITKTRELMRRDIEEMGA